METMGYWWTELRRSHPQVRATWWHVALALCVQMLLVGGSWAQGSAQERRTALVIGNSKYQKINMLPNALNDAQAMAAALGSLGYTVTKLENASKSQMDEAIRQFGERIKLGGVGLFYFAGHGIQVDGENLLLSVEVDRDDILKDRSQVATKALQVKLVLREMYEAKNGVNVIILDACREEPFALSPSRGMGVATGPTDGRTRSDSPGGFAPMQSLAGTLIAFATAPGAYASDGSGKNGVYTKNLLLNITVPGLSIEQVFKRTRFVVRQETDNKQVPWEHTSLEGDLYFVPPTTGSVAPSGSAGQATALAGGQQAALPPSRSDIGVAKKPPQKSFSMREEEEKDQAKQVARDDAIRARLQAPCPEALRQRPIIIDITEESRADGLIATDRSSRFAQLVSQNLQQAGLTTSLAGSQGQPAGRAGRPSASAGRTSYPQGHYSIQGIVLAQQGANRVARLNETSVNAEVALRDPAGRIITMVEVSGERFAGQNTRTAAWDLAKEQAHDASSQLYAAFCGARY